MGVIKSIHVRHSTHTITLRLLQVIASAEQDVPYENLVIQILNDTESTADSPTVCCVAFVFKLVSFAMVEP